MSILVWAMVGIAVWHFAVLSTTAFSAAASAIEVGVAPGMRS